MGAEPPVASDRRVAWWSFDAEPEGGVAREGVVGRAIRLDGFTTVVRRPSGAVPPLAGAFTAEAWVARVVHVRRLDRTDLVLWLPVSGTRPVSVRVATRAEAAGAAR